MRLTIKEAVEILKEEYKSITRIAFAIGASRRQLEYGLEKGEMKYELKIKLVRLAIKSVKKNNV